MCSSWQDFNCHSESFDSSAIAELFVILWRVKRVTKRCRTASTAVKGCAGNNNVKLDMALTWLPLIWTAIVRHHHSLILYPQHSSSSSSSSSSFYAHKHKAAWVKIEAKQIKMVDHSACYVRRLHFSFGQLWIGVGKGMLFSQSYLWSLWCACQFLLSAQWPCRAMYLHDKWVEDVSTGQFGILVNLVLCCL